MLRSALNSLLYFPERRIALTPADAGLGYEELEITTTDGERLGAWWVPAAPAEAERRRGHVLLAHGNAGNIGDRVAHAALLAHAGFDVLSFDYRGYGASTGSPDEEGTYLDARAAREALVDREEVDPDRIVYLGESLGGAVAIELASEHPPAGLVLLSTFTGVRPLAGDLYPFIPERLVPDAYPSLERIGGIERPVLLLHGTADEIVPLRHGEALWEAAPGSKRLRRLEGCGHNDTITRAGERIAAEIAEWFGEELPAGAQDEG